MGKTIIAVIVLVVIAGGGFLLLDGNNPASESGEGNKITAYIDDLGITNDLVWLLDPSDNFYRSIGGIGMPETIFVDDQANILFHKRGVMTLEEMREITQRVVAGEEDIKDPAPAFSYEDFSDNPVTLTDFPGKIAVVNSWATWCPFCVNELPDFVTLQREFENDIVVIAVNRGE